VVATPIGNLGDITLRALEILRTCDALFCEDTRRTRKLLSHFEISCPVVSLHGHNEEQRASLVVARVEAGHNCALVSDAGTPGVSDPGARAVRACRSAGFRVIPIPGVSAFACLVSAAGYEGSSLLFEGFLSPKAGRRRRRLEELAAREEAFVLYEGPHRILKVLDDLADQCGERRIVVGREMTKAHEEYMEGTPGEIRTILLQRGSPKGEFTILVSRRKNR